MNEVDEDLTDQVLNRIKRRKKRSKLSDDESADEDDLDAVSDEEDTEDIDDEEDSYDEAEEGEIVNKSHEEISAKILPDDERENGDGQVSYYSNKIFCNLDDYLFYQESENQENKSAKSQSSKVSKKSETEDKRNPQYIPRKGPFYEHDDRLNEVKSVTKTQEPVKTSENDEIDSEKSKSKKRLMASMKLRSDEMIEDDLDVDQLSSKSVSKEKIHDISLQSVEPLEKDAHIAKIDVKSPRELKKKPLWDSKDRWSHDKYIVDDQKPKSRDELISIYGYDIRNENEAPKLQRRSRYGKGPQKYSRRSEDESAYAKKALRKVIRPARNSLSEDYDSPSVVKKDQVFNNRHLPREHKASSKENVSSPANSKLTNLSETSNRIQENRVFVNKQSGPAPKLNKHDKPRSRSDQVKENFKSNENVELRRENHINVNDQDTNERSKELFTNEDFPELVSSAKAQTPVDKNNKGIIYYQNSPASSKSTSDSKNNKDTQILNSTVELKESNQNSDRPNHSLPIVKSQLYENSRFSRSRNHVPNNEHNTSWNSRLVASSKQSQISSNHHLKKHPSSVNAGKDEIPLNDINESNSNDSRPKRYSSIRQQQQRSVTVPSNSSNTTQSSTFTSTGVLVSQTTAAVAVPAQAPPQYITLNAEATASNNIITPEISAKNAYYEPASVSTNEIPHGQTTSLLPNAASHHHNYTTINGPSSAAPATGTAFIPTAAPLMAYYDPNAASGQAAGSTTTGLQPPIGLTQAYFTTDQAGTAQPATNYYLTTADHLTAVAYHPAYLPTNYPQQITPHHAHQSHVANRYLNTTPANAPSAESNRYLQTTPSTQNSTPLLVAGQAYQPTIQATFPSGYPQFPPPQTGATPAIGTSSPLPAGYPNVPMGSASTNASVASSQQTTPSGYPELYRGGITYYDIQSQQQAMQRQLQQSVTQQQQPRRKHHPGTNEGDHVENADVAADLSGKNAKHSTSKNEISVSN